MTSCLLDTNALSAILTDDPRIGKATRGYIAGCARVMLSAMSLYEIGKKVRLGIWPTMAPYIGELERIVLRDGIEILPLSGGAALQASVLEWAHRDPFDRMIAAVALRENCPLVSSDVVFEELGVSRIWG